MNSAYLKKNTNDLKSSHNKNSSMTSSNINYPNSNKITTKNNFSRNTEFSLNSSNKASNSIDLKKKFLNSGLGMQSYGHNASSNITNM